MGNYYVGREGDIYGFLKRGIIEKNCFITNNNFPSFKIFDDINIDTKVQAITSGTVCITLPSEINELFFLIHNLQIHYLSGYFSLYPGMAYEDYINIDEYFGYIPMKIEDDFNFITFHIHQDEGTIKAYIQNCEDYPFCIIEKNITDENMFSDVHLSTITYSFHKDELSSNISPIDKKRKMLVITCIDTNYGKCKVYINIYTDKTKTKIIDVPIQYRIIREANEDNLRIKYRKEMGYSNDYKFIAIEKLSGDFELYPNKTYKNYTYKNIIVFLLNSNDDIFSLKIKARKNSVYSIKSQFIIMFYFISSFGGNFLFVLKDIDTDYNNLQLLKNTRMNGKEIFKKFVNFHPINNCNKKVEFRYSEYYSEHLEMIPYKPEKSKNIFYQIFFSEELYNNRVAGDFIFSNFDDIEDTMLIIVNAYIM